jgi:adenylate cyclase
MARSGKVVIAYNITPGVELETVDDSLLIQRLGMIEKEGVTVPKDTIGEHESVKKIGLNVPIAPYAQAAAGMGVIRSFQDVDGSIRRVPTQLIVNGKAYPSLSLRMAQLASGTDHEALVRQGRYAANSRLRVPIDDEGRIVLAWRLSTMKPQRIPLWQIICSIYPQNCPAEVQKFAPDFFKDKIVMIGASAAASSDSHVMPLARKDEKLPGFIAHMNAVENYLSGRAVGVPPQWAAPALILLMSMVGAVIFVLIRSASLNVLAVTGIGGVYGLVTVLAFNTSYLWLPIIAPLSALLVAYIGSGLSQYATTGKELRQTRSTLDRYMSPELVKYVMEDPNSLSGQKKELSILFSDVRSFTTITEGSDPMELIATLNEYLEEMTDIIDKYYGITDKFIGDGILAYWGAFTPEKNHAELACAAALEMHERLTVLNDRWKEQGRMPLAIGVGVNTGTVVFGTVGTGRKREFTVIGDPVNLAARLESETKNFGVKVLISEYTVAKAGDTIVARALGGVKVKGKTVETQVFELQSMAPAAGSSAQSVAGD